MRRAAVLALALAHLSLAANEFLPKCSSSLVTGGQSTVGQRVFFFEIGGAEAGAPSPATGSCTAAVQATVTALRAYMVSMNRGDSITWFPLNPRTAVPDLTNVDQVWVRARRPLVPHVGVFSPLQSMKHCPCVRQMVDARWIGWTPLPRRTVETAAFVVTLCVCVAVAVR